MGVPVSATWENFTTAPVGGVAARSAQSSIARDPISGYTWMALWDGSSAHLTMRCVDPATGASITPTLGETVAFAGSTDTTVPFRSLFIDADGHAHLVYQDRHAGTLRYRRGVANTARTGWTWAAAVVITTSTAVANGADVIAHRDPGGTDWSVHVVYSWSSGNVTRCEHRRLAVTAAGAVTVGAATAVSPDHPVAGDCRPTLDFHHTGDGVTVKDGLPHLYVAWSGGVVANLNVHGIRARMASYAAGVWTWGTERGSHSCYVKNNNQWVDLVFTGETLWVAGQGTLDTGGVRWFVSRFDHLNDLGWSGSWILSNDVGTGGLQGSIAHAGHSTLMFVGRRLDLGRIATRVWDAVAADNYGPNGLQPWTLLAHTPPAAIPSAKRGNSGDRWEWVALTDTTSPYDVSWFGQALNDPPAAPTVTSPTPGRVVDRLRPFDVEWLFNDYGLGGDTQSGYEVRWRLNEDGQSWTTATDSTPVGRHTIAAGTLAVGQHELQVRTTDSIGQNGAWSPVVLFDAVTGPEEDVTILAPADNSTIGQIRRAVEWSIPNQDAYEVRQVEDVAGAPGLTVYETSGVVQDPSARRHVLSFPVNNRVVHIQVRARFNTLWTPWTTVKATVSYTPPGMPVVTVAGVDLAGVGTPHALRVTVTAGTGTPVVGVDIIVRDPATLEEQVIASGAPLGQYVWNEPAGGIAYDVAVTVHGNNGTATTTGWVSAQPVKVRGVLLHDPSTADGALDTLLSLPYNEDGAEDTWMVEAELVVYQGRVHPVAEFGDGSTSTIDVPLIHLHTRDQAYALRDLIARRAVLCYRDSKGRKAFGVILESQIRDVFYGHTTSVKFHVTDWDGAGS